MKQVTHCTNSSDHYEREDPRRPLYNFCCELKSSVTLTILSSLTPKSLLSAWICTSSREPAVWAAQSCSLFPALRYFVISELPYTDRLPQNSGEQAAGDLKYPRLRTNAAFTDAAETPRLHDENMTRRASRCRFGWIEKTAAMFQMLWLKYVKECAWIGIKCSWETYV